MIGATTERALRSVNMNPKISTAAQTTIVTIAIWSSVVPPSRGLRSSTSARIAATSRPITGTPVPIPQKITIRGPTPTNRTLLFTSVSASARAATGRRANSVRR
jgi:hypothetical protein